MTRIAELGLRTLARQLKIKNVKNKKPIEYAMWGEIIGVLRIAADGLINAKGNIKSLSKKQRDNREKKTEYYRRIMADMEALLSLRDKNAHFRDGYDRGEAYSAMHRVKEMMTLLARGSI